MTRVVVYEPSQHTLGTATVALGVFDGVHLGHQALVQDAIGVGHDTGAASCVVTFDRDPDQVVDPSHAAPQLLTLADKVAFLADLGPDSLLIVPFDAWLAALPPEAFVAEVLLKAVSPTVCVVGHDFRFGSGARGDVSALRGFGVAHGFGVRAHDLVELDGRPITSSRIRQAIARGNVADARVMLGRPHRLLGRVVRGKGFGRRIGAPTANLKTDPRSAVPAAGVYAARAFVGDTGYAAGVAIGIPPTFPASAVPGVEAHLIGYDGDLYGSIVRLEFIDRIRDQRPFESPDALAVAIQEDLSQVADIVGSMTDDPMPPQSASQ